MKPRRLAVWQLCGVACMMAGCAPYHTTREFVGVEKAGVRSTPFGTPTYFADVVASRGSARVRVTLTQDCQVVERTERVFRERKERGTSWGLVVTGAVLAVLGAKLVLDPGPSCEEEARSNPNGMNLCVIDERQIDRGLGTVLLFGGGLMALGGSLTANKEVRHVNEAGGESMHIAEACRRALGEHVRVMLSFKGGNRLSGMTDHKGEAIIAIDESLWVAGGGMLRGTAYVEGEPVRAFVLTNASPGSE